MKTTRRLTAWTCVVLISVCTPALLSAEQPVQSRKTVNAAAAYRALERAASLLNESRFEQASFEASLGVTYDPLMADFPYIEALALKGQGAPRADILSRVEVSLSDGLNWRSYDRRDAVRLCARLYAETCRYTDALSLIGTVSEDLNADADYVRLLSLYGLNRRDEAIALVQQSLERWPFDSRFAEVFLRVEQAYPPDSKRLDLARKILSRLYLWQEERPELLLLAVPYERTAASRERNIRMYRNMMRHETESPYFRTLAAVRALEYGLVPEETAVEELLALADTGIHRELLFSVQPLLVTDTVRTSFLEQLADFAGILVHDRNNDGIPDSRVQYRMGRPVHAEFDTRQTGYPEVSVTAELGEPAVITLVRDSMVITYDQYPAVAHVQRGDQRYTMRPQTLRWGPVQWKRNDSIPEGFFYLTIQDRIEPLTERMLVASALHYAEPMSDTPGGEVRYVLENSMPVMSEQRVRGVLYSQTTYRSGRPAQTLKDSNEDGYFETRMEYASDGSIATIAMDQNANRTFEYREHYTPDGTVIKKWDADEDGVYEIEWEISPAGLEKNRWIHPVSGRPVEAIIEKGQPRSVRYGTVSRPVLTDSFNDIQWIGRIPPNSREIAKIILQRLNREPAAVVCPMMEIDSLHFAVVRTGGFVFVELLDAQ